MKLISSVAAAALVATCSASQAGTLNWAFQGESGTFTTSGNIVVGTPGAFLITDFSVTATAVGATIGSEGSGAYQIGDYGTDAPYSLVWNGSTVTDWHKSAHNTFHWLVYRDVAKGDDFFFGWASPNINTIGSAAYYADSPITEGMATFEPAPAVPEPANLALVALGLLAVGCSARRTKHG